MATLNFNAEEVEPIGSFEPLPTGDYTVVISASEMKETKSGRGKYLQLVFDVVEGDYNGRKVFGRLNLDNENETARKIAQQELSAICYVLDIHAPKDSEELHDKPLIITVGIKDDPNYGKSNVVKGYKTKDGKTPNDLLKSGTTKVATKPETKTESPATNNKPKRPWDRTK